MFGQQLFGLILVAFIISQCLVAGTKHNKKPKSGGCFAFLFRKPNGRKGSQSTVRSKSTCSPFGARNVSPDPTPQRSSSSPVHRERLPDICTWSDNTLRRTFDQLSLKCLLSFAKMCPERQQLAGQYFYWNFRQKFRVENGKIHYGYDLDQINTFTPYVRSISIRNGDLSIFQLHHFTSLKKIEFFNGTLDNSVNVDSDDVKNILLNLNTLRFALDKLDGDIDKTIRHCENLKRLSVVKKEVEGDLLIGTSNAWLKNAYSSLEHFELEFNGQFEEVIDFLSLNQNIRNFSTTIEFLVENMDKILASNVKLDALAILHSNTDIDEENFKVFIDHLFTLQEQGFFQQLHLHFVKSKEQRSYPKQLLPSVRLLNIVNEYSDQKFSLTPLVNLQHLYIFDSSQIVGLDIALNELKNLENIYISYDSVKNILKFIRHLPKLQKMELNSILNGQHFNVSTNILNLEILERERLMCPFAEKLTIYLKENIYLATKREFRNTYLRFIKIKRTDAYDDVLNFNLK